MTDSRPVCFSCGRPDPNVIELGDTCIECSRQGADDE